ncbi:apolipoprotein N-acyltransferase [Arcobacter sp. 31_11_sub10_T18]|nr:apolipoprotein N-acyltransferase [Arcobacter sp. 31_11_sub10_T18]
MFLVKRDNFNKNMIIKGLCAAILFSSFIYLSYFNIENKIINSVLGLTSIYLILTIPKKSLFYTGFFIGIFWCWWLALSFEYYDLNYLMPLVILGVGLVYAIIFYFIGIIEDSIYIRAVLFFGFTFLAPFGFNWVKPELLFIDSYFGITKLDFALILLSMILLNKFKYLFWIPLVLSFYLLPSGKVLAPKLKISMPQLNVNQHIKWEKNYKYELISENINFINKAIEEKYDLIILPETAFPIILNKNENLLNLLKEKSKQIDIITGSLYKKDGLYHNSTYHFSKEKVNVAHKVVLVPFGEAVPLPEKIRNLINDMFYEGAKDYESAKEATTFNIKGIDFRNAICYEATTDEIFKNLGDTKYMIATSNNAWFTPSTQPILQKLLMKYYAKKYNVIVYSSANASENSIIYP